MESNNQPLSKAEQARINGAKSRGATTPEGIQAIVRANTKHGLYSLSATVLDIECQAAFDAIRDATVRHFAPRNEFEAHYVEEIADCSWRINRLLAAATAIGNQAIRDFRRSTPGRVTQPEALAHAEVGTDKQQLLQRRVSALMRTRKTLIAELLAAKKVFFAGDSQEPLKTQELPPEDSNFDSPGEPFDSHPDGFDSHDGRPTAAH